MAAPTREAAIVTLEEGHGALAALFARLDDDELSRPATIGGGDWSAKDLMGHVAFWEELAVRALGEWRAGETPWVEQLFGDKGVDAANAQDQARTAAQSVAEVRARAAAAHAAVRQAIESLTDEEWRAKAPYPTERRRTLGELLGGVLGAPKRPFGHAFAHLPDLETYVASLGKP